MNTKTIIYQGQGITLVDCETLKKNKENLLSSNYFLSRCIDRQGESGTRTEIAPVEKGTISI
jgi:hypothetical protein